MGSPTWRDNTQTNKVTDRRNTRVGRPSKASTDHGNCTHVLDRQTDRQTDRRAGGRTDRQTNGQTEGQKGRRTDRRADRQLTNWHLSVHVCGKTERASKHKMTHGNAEAETVEVDRQTDRQTHSDMGPLLDIQIHGQPDTTKAMPHEKRAQARASIPEPIPPRRRPRCSQTAAWRCLRCAAAR
jgi:hypothetical protein